MYGSLEASATSKYPCLVIFEVFQGPLKLTFSREWPNGKEAYPIPYKKALVFRSNLLQPAYFFASPTSKAGGEPSTIQRSNHNAAVLIIFTLCWLL